MPEGDIVIENTNVLNANSSDNASIGPMIWQFFMPKYATVENRGLVEEIEKLKKQVAIRDRLLKKMAKGIKANRN